MLARVVDELKPPVAIRITRPYATETEFLEREFDTLTHTGVTLLGAQSRPQGVVLRFEIVLTSGESILRGEGRVVGFKERAYAGEPGLVLRFTRLDSRSKSLVDRASALREARVRASSSLMSMPAVVVPKPLSPVAPLTSAAPAPITQPTPRAAPAAPPRPSSAPPRPSRIPPPLPAWAKAPTPAPAPASADVPIDVESTQVDANFDPFPKPLAEPPVAEARLVWPEPPVIPAPPPSTPSVDISLDELTASSEGPVAAPEPVRPSAPPPAPTPKPAIRPTAPRPPPLPRTVAPLTSSRPAPASLAAPSAPSVVRSPAAANPRARSPRSTSVERPANREALLASLRARARNLPASRVEEILAKRG